MNLFVGFVGQRCEERINECRSNPCLNGGTCQQVLNGLGFNCFCPFGFTGATCNIRINFCADNSCKNGASCVERSDGFACQCLAGYTGFDCSIQINL